MMSSVEPMAWSCTRLGAVENIEGNFTDGVLPFRHLNG